MGCSCLSRTKDTPSQTQKQTDQPTPKLNKLGTDSTSKSTAPEQTVSTNSGTSPTQGPTRKNSVQSTSLTSNLSRTQSLDLSFRKSSIDSPNLTSRGSKTLNRVNTDFDPMLPEYGSDRYTRHTAEHQPIRGKKHVTAAYRVSKNHVILETSFR